MKCEESERKILLVEAGDLSPRELASLEQHLAACPGCREYRDGTARLVATAREALPADGPAPSTIARIRAAAAERAAHGAILFPRPVVQAMAYAAALLVIVGAWFLLQDDTPRDGIGELGTILAMVSEEEFLEGENGGEGDEYRLRALAGQILSMQGLAADDLDDLEATDPDAGLPPTTLRSRSGHALPATRRV